MQSISTPEPPIQFSANKLTKIERINSLIEKLDTKLDRLCALHSWKNKDNSRSRSQPDEKSPSKFFTETLLIDHKDIFDNQCDCRKGVIKSECNCNKDLSESSRTACLQSGIGSYEYCEQLEKTLNAIKERNSKITERALVLRTSVHPFDTKSIRSESPVKSGERPEVLLQSPCSKASNSTIVAKCFINLNNNSEATGVENVEKVEKVEKEAYNSQAAKVSASAVKKKTKIITRRSNRTRKCNRVCYKQANPPFKMNVIPPFAHSVPVQIKRLPVEPQESSGAAQLKSLSNIYRAKVIDAYRNRQIFTVFGNYNTIRRALLKRGWLEKLPPSRHAKLQNLPEDFLLQHAKRGNEYEAVVISKIINHFPAFFVWQPKGQRDLYTDVLPYRNRIRRTHMLDFSTKVGLIGCAEQQMWYLQDGVAGMLYPRFYRMGGNQEEQAAFTEDFRITQCRSLLSYLVANMETPSEIVDFENGVVSSATVHFALGRVRRQLDDWDNMAGLDMEPTQIPDTEWNDFLVNSAKILNANQKVKCPFREMVDIVKAARILLDKCVEKRPDFKWDGYKNVWILKPGYQSRGLGIVIRNNLEEILRWSSSHSNRRYIVQKYIEQPLLIYRTKFDIRQYMLVVIRESTVQIWLYKDCYLRFSSQEYDIDDLREVVHLTNNSVQKKYKVKPTRDPRLPKNNMWSLDQFRGYLQTQTGEDVWENRVFAGFRTNLIAVVMASLDETNLCENSFELYGCDFMLDQQYNPILIEINSTPDMSASTEVTAHICPMVMHDCIKVIVDLPRNSRAMTGLFKMVYEVNYKFKQDLNSRDNLNINGKSVELLKRKQFPLTKPVKIKKNDIRAVVKKPPPAAIEAHKKTPATIQVKKINTKKDQGLKAVTKEVLALRYTLPK